jgi:hypothetical protein
VLLYWPRLPFDETQVQWFASALLDNGPPHSFFEQAVYEMLSFLCRYVIEGGDSAIQYVDRNELRKDATPAECVVLQAILRFLASKVHSDTPQPDEVPEPIIRM